MCDVLTPGVGEKKAQIVWMVNYGLQFGQGLKQHIKGAFAEHAAREGGGEFYWLSGNQ